MLPHSPIASRAGAFCPGSVIFVRIANTRHYPLPLFKMASPGNPLHSVRWPEIYNTQMLLIPRVGKDSFRDDVQNCKTTSWKLVVTFDHCIGAA
jgi:hypothetical protein